jgi:hypothetical protein
MLPSLAAVVPMETKLRQLPPEGGGRNLAEQNPNLFAGNPGSSKKRGVSFGRFGGFNWQPVLFVANG